MVAGYTFTQQFNWNLFAWTSGIAIAMGLLLWWRYYKKTPMDLNITWKEWAWLFFWAIFTHPILDTFTSYGTQLFLPFSNYRAAWDTISVVDPLYTFPLMICLIIAGLYSRRNRWRRFWNWLGLGISSIYLLFTLCNKSHIDQVFEQALEEQHIESQKTVTNPTIFNNFLWQCIAESDSVFYHSDYSLFDEGPHHRNMNILPKQHELLEGHLNDPDIKTLRWFSDDFYNVVEREDGTLQFNNMRYGIMQSKYHDPSDYIFNFTVHKADDGTLYARTNRDPEKVTKESFRKFQRRVFGDKKAFE